MEEPHFKQNVSERMWKMEGLFAEAKQNHCLARARYRGRSKVQIQAYLIAIVQNLKRLLFPFSCWLLTPFLRSACTAAHCSPVNSTRPKSTPQMPAVCGLFQPAQWLFGMSHANDALGNTFVRL